MDPDQINELSGDPNGPLAFRMMEHLPGMTSAFFFAQHRGSNTIMRGGFMDDRRRGPGKLGGFARGSNDLIQPSSRAFVGTPARRARMAQAAGTSQGKMALTKGFTANHITARPRALNRYSSLSIFNASENAATYSPFSFVAKMGGNQLKKSKSFRDAFYDGREIGKEEQVMQRGMVSMITAGRKADRLERRAIARGPDSRAAARLAKTQTQVTRLAAMNNPSLLQGRSTTQIAAGMRNAPIGSAMQAMSPADRLAAARAAGPQSRMSPMATALSGGTKIGLTGDLMIDAMKTPGAQGVGGYLRTVMGQGQYMTSAGGVAGRELATKNFQMAIQKAGIAGPFDEKVFQGSVIKNLGGYRNTLKVATASKQGAMALGARAGMMAIPGLNVIATASLVYDLGKMGGELVKSGATLAKDAVSSMRGSIDKPLFGMGYKDNEVSATSRARGVMAIQNSRLNARSMLGSEAGMMAAHFG